MAGTNVLLEPETASGQENRKIAGIIPAAATRVPEHTTAEVQERIRLSTLESISQAIVSPQIIENRLRELDREWDTERILELNASLLALSGVLLGRFVHRNWLYLSLGVTAFLAQHAVQGWCPPLPILRRLGVRTRKEIEQERNALKMIRGDRPAMSPMSNARQQAEELLRVQEL